MADQEMGEAETLERRLRRRLGGGVDGLLAKLRENSITILEVQNGIKPAELRDELEISEGEAIAIVLDDTAWLQQFAWLDDVIIKLPPHFESAMKDKVRSAIISAGVKTEDQLRNMSADDLAKAKVPLAARGWISENYKLASANVAPTEIRTTAPSNPRLVLGASRTPATAEAADTVLLEAMVSMGFPEAASAIALVRTRNIGVQEAIDYIMANPSTQLSQPAAPDAAPVVSQQPSAARAPQPAAQPSDAPRQELRAEDKITSSFDLAAREEHARREQEARMRRVKEEQAAKKKAQLDIKQQLAEDQLVRRITHSLRRSEQMSAEELEGLAGEIDAFLATSRPCDELTSLRDRIRDGAAVRRAATGTAEPAAAAGAAAAAPAAGGGGALGGPAAAAGRAGGVAAGARSMLRIRMDDGSQVTEEFDATQTIRDVHERVAARRAGGGDFALILPGPPVLRREFAPGTAEFETSLAAAQLVPNGALTVQALEKKDKVTKAPDGASFGPGRGPAFRGGRAGPAGLRAGMGGMMGGLGGMMGGRGGGMGWGGGLPAYGGGGETDSDEGGDDDDEMDVGGGGGGGGGAGRRSGGARARADVEDGSSDEMGDGDSSMDPGLLQAQTASLNEATDRYYSGAGGPDMPAAAQRSLSDELGVASEDVPEEFLDPLTQICMRDPVVLPSSGAVLDRSTIMRHLKTNGSDPYTKTPLNPRMLTPAAELAARIAAWAAGVRAAGAAGAAAAAAAGGGR